MRSAALHILLLLVTSIRGADIISLPSVDCVDNSVITIQVTSGDLTIDGKVSYSTRMYSVNGVKGVPASIIKMHPGTTCTLRLQNSLTGDRCTIGLFIYLIKLFKNIKIIIQLKQIMRIHFTVLMQQYFILMDFMYHQMMI